MIREFLKLLNKNLGVIVVPEWRAVQIDLERHLSRLFRYLDVDCVFDVGANVGQYGKLLRNYIGYRGQIVSFEPNPKAFDRLQLSVSGDRRWHVEKIALGSNPGIAEFHAYDLSDLGSFFGFATSPHAPRAMGSTTVNVEVRTIESYLPSARQQWDFKRPFLKLDTQGFDLEVAKGAGASLREFVGLQSEIAFQPVYAGAPDYLSSLKFYQSRGFVLSRLVPIHEINFPELVEMDAIMIRADLIRR